MTYQPMIFEININEFDFDILPLKIDTEMLKGDPKLRENAVKIFYENHFKDVGGEVKTDIKGDFIKVYWWPKSSDDVDQAIALAVDLLSKGAYGHAEPLLSTLYSKYPDHENILYNYGMMLSDQGKLEKALNLLSRLTTIQEDNPNAWNALGIAYMRNSQPLEAKKALQRSYELDPDNGYTLRNLGGLLAKENAPEALPYLKKASGILADDQKAQYGYALCLLQNKFMDEADLAFIKTIEINPYSEISELCRTHRTEIAQKTMRDTAPGLRMDAVMYCLSALKKFQEVEPQEAAAITMEIALLGRGGLDINDPEPKYTLKSLSGKFSGLQLVSYMYVGVKRMDPNQNPGIDLEKEYLTALSLFNKKS